MRKFLISVPVSAMIGKQGKNFTTAKIFKKVCKTLFVTVTTSKEPVCPRVELILKIIIILLIIFLGLNFIKSKPC